MNKTNRRGFLGKGAAAAAGAGVAASTKASAQTTGELKKVVHYAGGKKPKGTPLFNEAVSYGNLLFIAGIGAHFPGDIKAHTDHVLNEIQKQLEAAGSSMDKVLKVVVFLADLKDYDGMNEVFRGRFGAEPGVRTTVAVAGVPGKSLVEMDVIAYI
ncbi:MAG: RidA family protein [Bryobacteraceae bacterium]